jgi:hypothetical protein
MGKSGLSTMKKTVHCKCKSGCSNRRCVCLQNNESCDELCGCSNCKNPLNGTDVETLSICTIQNIEEYKYLSIDELEERYGVLSDKTYLRVKIFFAHFFRPPDYCLFRLGLETFGIGAVLSLSVSSGMAAY